MEITVAEIRERSNVEWAEHGYLTGETPETDRLRFPLEEAVPEFQSYTGVDVAAVQGDPEAEGYDPRAPLIRRAVRMLVEYNVGASQQEIVDTAIDYDMIQSFGVGSYNESRRAVSSNRTVLHPWPALNKLLLGIIYFTEAGSRSDDGPALGQRPITDVPGRESMDLVTGRNGALGIYDLDPDMVGHTVLPYDGRPGGSQSG